jgi:hypothetical protein
MIFIFWSSKLTSSVSCRYEHDSTNYFDEFSKSPYKMDPLSRHDASLDCGWTRRLPDMETGANRREKAVLQLSGRAGKGWESKKYSVFNGLL